MNKDDSIDAIKYQVYKQKFDEIYKETEDFGRIQFVDKIISLQADIMAELLEKQSLIKYLEDRIKQLDSIPVLPNTDKYYKLIDKIETYREILDKVKEGNYE